MTESGIKKAMNEESMAQFHCTTLQFSSAVYVARELLTPWSSLSQETYNLNLNDLRKFVRQPRDWRCTPPYKGTHEECGEHRKMKSKLLTGLRSLSSERVLADRCGDGVTGQSSQGVTSCTWDVLILDTI